MKKILSLLLSLILVLSCSSLTAFSADDESLISEKELGVLQAFGIIESADISAESLDAVMTRGEASKYFCDILNLDIADVQGFESIFYDVSSENPYYKYIKALFDAGYVRGDGDGRFRPTAPITAQEAARVMTDIAGYKGYTAVLGLNRTIQTTEVLEGVPLMNHLSWNGFLKMAYNILHSPACRAVSFGNSIEYEIDENVKVMESVFDIVFSKGIVDGNDKFTLKGELSNIRDGYVVIDGLAYADKTGKASELLGYSVEFYYQKSNDLKEIVYIYSSEKNNVKVLSDDVIIDYSDFTYKYEENNRTKEASIESYTDVVLNGVACDTPDDEKDFVPAFGQVTLVDNNDDRKYDVVFVENYEFILVKSINVEKKLVYDVNGEVYDFEESDVIDITYQGIEYSFERILGGNLLKVKSSKKNEDFVKTEIEIIKETLDGTEISSVTTDTLTTKGKTYEIYEYIDEKSRSYIRVGNKVNLYVCDDIVVRVEAFNTNNYAYLLSMSKPENFDKTVKFMMVKYGVEEVVYEMADRIKIDSVTVSDPDSIRSLLLASASLSVGVNNGSVAQPIKYTLTKNGKLASIDTLETHPGEDPETCLKKLDETAFDCRSDNGGYYVTENEESILKAVYSSSALTIPQNDIFTIEKYYMSNIDDSVSNVEVYDVDPETMVAGAVFHYRELLDGGSSTPYLVLDKWAELSATGEKRNVLKLAYISTVNDYPCLAEVDETYDILEIGDLISIATNSAGEIRGITKKFSVSTVPSLSNRVLVLISSRNSTKSPPYLEGTRIIYGTPLNAVGGSILITPSLPTDEGGLKSDYRVDNLIVGNVPVWKYETVRGNVTITQGNMSDIVTYSIDPEEVTPIVVDIRNGTVKQIIVICD